MVDRPDSLLDRTAGRYVNLGMNARYLDGEIEKIESLRKGSNMSERLFFKVFPYRKGCEPGVPMTHGSFDDFHFWEESF